MAIEDDIIEILSPCSAQHAMHSADLYKKLKIDLRYSDDQIDEALKKMLQEGKLAERVQRLATAYWLK